MTQAAETSSAKKRNYRGASSSERSAQRRRQLIEAAIGVYGELGYRRASVKAVCAAAGLTDRYFYEEFANSEALLAACFEEVVGEVIMEITEAGDLSAASGVPRGRAMLLAYFAALRREAARAKVFLVEMVGISDDIDRTFDLSLDRIAERIVDTLDPNREGPVARDPLLARGVASGLIGIAVAWIRSGYSQPIEAAAEAALGLCLAALPTDRCEA